MTNYIILALCLIVFLAYIFDLTSKYSKIPGVILLIALGILMQVIANFTGLNIPNLKPFLPVIGTIGLILIVLEASFDLQLHRNKSSLILKSISSAILIFLLSVAAMAFVFVKFMHVSVFDSLLNAIPLGVISSAVAISAGAHLPECTREFIVYESSFSDIIGIVAFDFVLVYYGTFLKGFLSNFVLGGLIILFISIILTVALAYLLNKSTYHVNYVIILTSVIFAYSLAKIIHLPALLLVLIFGLVMANSRILENSFFNRFFDFHKLSNDLVSFKKIAREITFLVRSFFFIMFGFYVKIDGLLTMNNIATALAITSFVFLVRWFFLEKVFRVDYKHLAFFAPRGLITILLFLSIPEASRIPAVNEEVITLMILISIIILMIGNIVLKTDEEVVCMEPIDLEEVTEENDYSSRPNGKAEPGGEFGDNNKNTTVF